MLRLFSHDKAATYTLFQNGRHFSVLLFSCKLPLVASFLTGNSKEYFPLNQANLQVNKKKLKIAVVLE